MDKKYFSFWVNDEVFVVERSELKNYDLFCKVMADTDFKREDLRIDFGINNKLINLAHNLKNYKPSSLNINEIVKIYDYINYLIPKNIDENIANLLYHYKVNNYDYDFIDSLDDDIYLKLKVQLKKIVFKFDITKTTQYIKLEPTRQLINKIQYYLDNPIYTGKVELSSWWGPKYYEFNDTLDNFIKEYNKNNNYITLIYVNSEDYLYKNKVKYITAFSTFEPEKKIIYRLSYNYAVY